MEIHAKRRVCFLCDKHIEGQPALVRVTDEPTCECLVHPSCIVKIESFRNLGQTGNPCALCKEQRSSPCLRTPSPFGKNSKACNHTICRSPLAFCTKPAGHLGPHDAECAGSCPMPSVGRFLRRSTSGASSSGSLSGSTINRH